MTYRAIRSLKGCLGLTLTYELFDFDVLGLADDALADIVSQLIGRGFSGVNITHPFRSFVRKPFATQHLKV